MTDLEMAYEIAKRVESLGGKSYFVGGYVRDFLRGKESKDLDLEIHGIRPNKLEEVLDSLGERISIGESFGIFALKGYSLDVAMPRKETKRGEGHRDFDILVDPFCGPKKAAERRDFTINAMMQDVLSGSILDPFGGQKDLEDGVIRHVNPESFGEDPLRVLRGAQFAARFDFEIAEETKELCRKMDLEHLAPERILGEMEKALLKAQKPSLFFENLRDMDALGHWFPELEKLIGIPQNPKYHAEGDVWVHTMMVLDEAARLREIVHDPFPFMLSALCHDFGKAVTTEIVNGQIHTYAHESRGIPLVEQFLRRITSETRLIRYVLNLTLYHMKPNVLAGANAPEKSTNKMFDESEDPIGLICLAVADGLGKISPSPYVSHNDFFRRRYDLYRETMAKPHVLGRDLIAAGLKPDQNFSDYLAFAHKLRLAGIEKESALKQTLSYARGKKKEL